MNIANILVLKWKYNIEGVVCSTNVQKTKHGSSYAS